MTMYQAGDHVDRFEVLGLLGGGGAADVFLVRHRDLNVNFALKVLRYGGGKAQERTLREGRAQAVLGDHANILPVRDTFLANKMPALLMDYVAGPSLDKVLRELFLDDSQVDAIARGTLKGVAHAHAHGLFHRDIKPANVLLDLADGTVNPLVADFGLVKVHGNTEGFQTRAGAVMGTPTYMPPEQIRDASEVDARADVFSLGCLLYELLCRRPPFRGQDLVQLHADMVAEKWVPVRRLNASAPARMVHAIECALRPRVEDRPVSAAALLDLWCGEEPAPVPATTWPPPIIQVLRGISGDKAVGSAPVDNTLAPAVLSAASVTYTHESVDTQVAAVSVSVTSAPDPPDVEPAVVESAVVEPNVARAKGGAVSLAMGAAVLVVVGGLLLLLLVGSTSVYLGLYEGDPLPVADVAPPIEPDRADGASIEPVISPVDPPAVVAKRTVTASPGSRPVATQPAEVSSAPIDLSTNPESATEPVAEPTKTRDVARRPARSTATWSVRGFDEVWLEDVQGVRRSPGSVPPGRYRLVAAFDEGRPLTPVGTVNLVVGSRASVQCVVKLKQCQVLVEE